MGASGSASNSNSISRSDAASAALSQSFNNSASSSFNNSMNQASSFGRNDASSNSFVDASQQPYLDATRAAGMGMLGQGSGDIAMGQAQNQGMLDQAMAQNMALMDPSQQIASQSASLQSGLGDLFRNEINPAIEGNALMAGGLGGGRQGVAQGVAAGQLGNTYASAMGDITARANAQSQGAVNSMAGLGQANLANRGALASFNMGQLGDYAGILGGPTVLNQSQSTGRTGSSSYGRSNAGSSSRSNAGSRSVAESYSQQRSKSGSQSASFGFKWM